MSYLLREVTWLVLLLAVSANAKDLPSRTCHRLFSVSDAAKAKYLLCFQRGTFAELDFTHSPLTGEKFEKIPVKVKECHVNQPPLARTYNEVKKLVNDGKWEFHFGKIDKRFSDMEYRHDDLIVRQDGAGILDATSGLDSVGTGWCFWREKPLSEQKKDENCVNALACSELTPEYCDCKW